MSKYETVKDLPENKFRRLTGVKQKTFNKMAEILRTAQALKKAKGGRPNKRCIEDMLLMALEYLREYRTYFHIGQSYGLSESNTYYAIKWVEDTLIKDGTFSLPGKKELLESGTDIEVLLVDAAESPPERPKKDRSIGIRERKSDTQ